MLSLKPRRTGDVGSCPCYKVSSRSPLQHPRDGGTISAHAQQARRLMNIDEWREAPPMTFLLPCSAQIMAVVATGSCL